MNIEGDNDFKQLFLSPIDKRFVAKRSPVQEMSIFGTNHELTEILNEENLVRFLRAANWKTDASKVSPHFFILDYCLETSSPLV